jgi:ABC-type multidrug transport system fused ATPase/permease subunit
VSVTIPKGHRVGIAGKTGSGKSTLMDLVLGLVSPASGRILIDGTELTDANRSSWQAQIAHVPQLIYLADATVAENIAFGIEPEKIDRELVRKAAERAELTDVIAGLPKGYDTFVGERGVRLSGGQRQRIGIARALYKRADVLVFDEATSALDNETEAAVMDAIDRLDRNLTIIIIAHRLSTLDGCDTIVRLENGRIKALEENMVRPAAPTSTFV